MFEFLKAAFGKKPTVPAATGGKDFEQELYLFNSKLKAHKNFSLARYGDGEMIVINGESIDLSGKYNGEHRYTPGDASNERQRTLLQEALTYSDAQYYIGIACPCCVGEEKFFALKNQSKQAEAQLTWANIFVNANYARFKSDTVDILSNRDVALVCHQNATLDDLPFAVTYDFRVGANAWMADYDRLLSEITTRIESEKIENHVFLFCAGVLSNLLIHKLHQTHPENTYLDIGSVFDVELGLGKTRKYLKKGKTLRKTCVWL